MSDTQAPGTPSEKHPRKRSPSYPAVNLEEAIKRARTLWEKEHEYPTPLLTVFKHWGYASPAGQANVVIAALRKFGLVAYEGEGTTRKAKVTPLAILILDHHDPQERQAAIRRAALEPSIHQELWSKYGAKLPSDDALRWELERERDFSRSGAAEFIREFRETIAFAGLQDGDKVPQQEAQPGSEGDGDDEEEADETDRRLDTRKKTARRVRVSGTQDAVVSYAVPVAPGLDVSVEGPFPLTEVQWRQFQAVLNAMKLGLVKDDEAGLADDEGS